MSLSSWRKLGGKKERERRVAVLGSCVSKLSAREGRRGKEREGEGRRGKESEHSFKLTHPFLSHANQYLGESISGQQAEDQNRASSLS